MAATKRAASRPSNPYTSSDPDALSPANRIAHDILVERVDLLPSVDRIMTAGLDEDDALKAITLFQRSLTKPGDPNRDPRVAIAAVTGVQPQEATS
jgi:hypothetical protein